VVVRVRGLTAARNRVSLARVDETHSNVVAAWSGEQAWPDPETWRRLHAADRLWEQQVPDAPGQEGDRVFRYRVPMPGVIRLRLRPEPASFDQKEGK
jgi:xylan 1,4-beta-xylosidase